ncbi:hypothetical protein C0J52_02201 [Blattella germanica]|nr:hypothetical protein C0J52_02201 [Blattella germanica]
MDVLPAILLFLLPLAAFSIKAVPKLDFGDSEEKEGKNESPGITPEYIKSILEKGEHTAPDLSPGVIKAVLEVNVGGLVTKKPETKTENDKDKKKKNEVLICTLDGKCKLHVIESGENSSDDKTGDKDGKPLKPIIVSDFDVDPTTEGGEDDDKSGEGKDIPKVPVIVGLKGAVKDDDFPYHTGHGHQVDRLPVYYGMKLSPEFHRPYPQGPVIYEEEPHYPPYSGSYPSYPPEHGVNSHPTYPHNHGVSSYPGYPHEHGVSSKPNYPQEHGVISYYPHEQGVSYLYEQDDDQYPDSIYPGYGGSKPYYNNYFSGSSGPRTPRPYGKFHPTSSPNFHPVLTPLHRRVGGGGGDWSTRPGVLWPSQIPSNEIPRPENNGWTGSDRPGLYWPSRPVDDPTKHIISVRAKMDEDSLKGDKNPNNPSPPNKPGDVVVDGKLGKPLDKTE